MADKKITELQAATAPTGVELIEIVQGGVNKQTTTQDIANLGGGGSITSVNGDTGPAVTLDAVDIPNTPAGTIAATTVQAAINELDTEKAALTAVIGVQDLFVSAAAMWQRLTNGCSALTQIEMATSLANIQGLLFDATTQEFAQFQIILPRKYNNATITAVPVWTATSGSGTVQWGISFGSYRNDDALTVALGTPQTSDDTLLAANDFHEGPVTSAITPAGTLQDSNFIIGQISRNPASDTLAVDAVLLGISLRITTDAAIDG